MSIHNLRYSIQLIKIAKRNKTNRWKITIFWRWNQLCARHSYVCRHGLYVVYIVTQTPSFRRSRDLDKSNTLGQMQALTNDYYSEIKLHNIFHIAYQAIRFSTNKKEPTLSFPFPILERQPLYTPGGILGDFKGSEIQKSGITTKRVDQLAPNLVHACGFIWEWT